MVHAYHNSMGIFLEWSHGCWFWCFLGPGMSRSHQSLIRVCIQKKDRQKVITPHSLVVQSNKIAHDSTVQGREWIGGVFFEGGGQNSEEWWLWAILNKQKRSKKIKMMMNINLKSSKWPLPTAWMKCGGMPASASSSTTSTRKMT